MADKYIEEVELPQESLEKTKELAERILKAEEKKTTIGLIIGLICIVAGIILILLGVDGSIDWTLKGMGLESNLAKASPGVVLAVIGLIIIWVTRFSFKIK